MICRRCGNRIPEHLAVRESFKCPECGRQFGEPMPEREPRYADSPRSSRYASDDRYASRESRYASDDRYASREDRYASDDSYASRESRYASRDDRYASDDRYAVRESRRASDDRYASREDRYASDSRASSRRGRFEPEYDERYAEPSYEDDGYYDDGQYDDAYDEDQYASEAYYDDAGDGYYEEEIPYADEDLSDLIDGGGPRPVGMKLSTVLLVVMLGIAALIVVFCVDAAIHPPETVLAMDWANHIIV